MDAGISDASFRLLVEQGVDGVVMAGIGHGNAPAPLLATLKVMADAGITIVCATRIGDGLVDTNREVSDETRGLLVARDLNPQKSRILLQLLLATGSTIRVPGSGPLTMGHMGIEYLTR